MTNIRRKKKIDQSNVSDMFNLIECITLKFERSKSFLDNRTSWDSDCFGSQRCPADGFIAMGSENLLSSSLEEFELFQIIQLEI